MKKGKEWLKNEIEIMGSETSENYPHEQMVGIELVMKLIDQLEEPEKVVIPQFVATFIEDSRNKVGNIVTAIWDMYTYEHKDIYEWSLEDNNDEVLMQAFANGYEVEKEKLYRVEMHGTDGLLLTLEGSEYYFDEPLDYVGERPDIRQEFTESEIKAIDERYWLFAMEVVG